MTLTKLSSGIYAGLVKFSTEYSGFICQSGLVELVV